MAELRRFLQNVGDLPVAEISREDIRAFETIEEKRCGPPRSTSR
jgi:hypothetical protein